MIKEKIQLTASKLLASVSYLFPVHKKRVIFKSYDLKYNCNTKYMCEYLNNNYKDEFELIYVTANPISNPPLNKKGIKTCKIKSLKYHYYMFTSKFIFVNHSYPQYLPKKKNQIVIFTDHGIDIFKYIKNRSENQKQYIYSEYKKINKFLFSSDLDAKNGKQTFGCDDERIMYTGLPRISPFFDKNFKCENDIKKVLKINENKKTILYAPTFRKGHKKNFLEDDFAKIIEACEKRFGGEFVILNRDHNFTLKDDGTKYKKSKIYECNVIEDVQELIYSCDVIISDYSSIMWDASFSKHPCFLYMYDLEEYTKTWEFLTDINKWPFPHATGIDEFCDLIINFNQSDYDKKKKEFYDYIGLHENGSACKQVYDYMASQI